MPRIDLSRQAADFLQNLPPKQARQIAEKLRQLGLDPAALPSEALKGYAPMRRLKSGEFRIIFAVEDDLVQVRLIGKRNDDDIYKALERAWKK
jgi:mRNA interferase RelE/StbE